LNGLEKLTTRLIITLNNIVKGKHIMTIIAWDGHTLAADSRMTFKRELFYNTHPGLFLNADEDGTIDQTIKVYTPHHLNINGDRIIAVAVAGDFNRMTQLVTRDQQMSESNILANGFFNDSLTKGEVSNLIAVGKNAVYHIQITDTMVMSTPYAKKTYLLTGDIDGTNGAKDITAMTAKMAAKTMVTWAILNKTSPTIGGYVTTWSNSSGLRPLQYVQNRKLINKFSSFLQIGIYDTMLATMGFTKKLRKAK
jgi:hypothetical protein